MIRKLAATLAVLAVLIVAAGGYFYQFVLPGLSSARQTPQKIEVALATWLLLHSVPEGKAKRADPLAPNEADITAGAAIFQSKCAVCHGFDGRGHTTLGEHVYPRVPSLRELMPTLTDGDVFIYIHDGIRNTAMPAWTLPDRQIWQTILFLRHLPASAGPAPKISASVAGAHFVGSAACQSCHKEIYARWKKTRMANVVRDPRLDPEAIIPDFSKPDPVLTFTKNDVAFVYGSRLRILVIVTGDSGNRDRCTQGMCYAFTVKEAGAWA